jgi:hypothetical protein
MPRFHVSQDETGYFQLTYEDDEGNLKLMSYQYESPDQLIEDAVEMAKSGKFGSATVVVDPRRRPPNDGVAFVSRDERPAPRKAGA